MQQMRQVGTQGLRERARWSSCGLIAGLVVGMILGWIFHGFVGTAVRVGVVLLFLIPLFAALVFWLSSRRGDGGSSAVQEATWRDLDGPGGRT
jgi:F0F1-type ATP synthase assembly protein I